MALPAPWNQMEESLRDLQDFGAGAQRLSDFFKGMEERHGPDELLEKLLTAGPTQKWLERFLFSLFDIGVSDKQIGTRALELRRVRRLWARASIEVPLSDEEYRIVENVAPLFSREPAERESAVSAARGVFARLLEGQAIADDERQALAMLVRSEAEALRDRVNWLSENADPYNMKTMARVLPRLRIYDEAVAEGMELAGKLDRREPVGVRVLSFEMHMKGAFEKWCRKVGGPESLAVLSGLLQEQRVKKIPTIDLVALSSLCRWTYEVAGQRTGPFDWVTLAFKCYRDGEFEVDAGQSAAMLASALSNSGVKAHGSRLRGHFGKKLYPALVGRDLLTKPFLKAADEGLLDMKSVIAQNITRDSVIEALLNNPKVQQTPGLVAFVAETSRSVAVLSRIAKSRALHSGYANKEVPLALLRSPCTIPIALLRPFINVRNVSLMDLKLLARSKAGVRRDVKLEVERFLDSRI
jgi:hypothetical protein